MKTFQIKFVPAEQRFSPMTPTVHLIDSGHYLGDPSAIYTPPLPAEVPGKGFPALYIEAEGFQFHFASMQELEKCIAVLSQKHLPSLHEEMGVARNQHWLNRLPSEVKSWNHREKIIKYLAEVKEKVGKENIF